MVQHDGELTGTCVAADCITLDATEAALAAIERVRAVRGDDLTFLFDGGCCEATAPYLYDRYVVDADRVQIGEVAGIAGYMPAWLVELFRSPVQLTIDLNTDVVSDSFSAEVEFGCRFVLKQSACPTDPAA